MRTEVLTVPLRGDWVRRLAPDQLDTVEPVCLPETIESAIRQVGRGPVQWAVGIAQDHALRAIAIDPAFGTSEFAVRTLRLGTESAAIRILLGIDAGDLSQYGPTAEAEPIMHDYVHRRIPLERIWASIRLGHRWLAENYMTACRDLVELDEQPEQLALVSRIIFDFINAFAAQVGDTYHEEEHRWLSSAAAARDKTVRAILAGEEPQDASRILRYDLANQHHLAIVVRDTDTTGTEPAALHHIATETLAQFGATSTLILAAGRNEVWAWGRSAAPFVDVTDNARRIDSHGISVCTGNPGYGIEGFRTSHSQAEQATRVAELSLTAPHGVLTFSSVSLLALLTNDPMQASAFVDAELAGLNGDDPQSESLRETVLTYLNCRRSPQAAANQLFVAKNTVVYRVRRAEELLGRTLDQRQPELWTALLLAQAFTPANRHAPTPSPTPRPRAPRT